LWSANRSGHITGYPETELPPKSPLRHKPGAPGPSHLGTGDTTNPMRANSERLAAPQVLADNYPPSSHNNPQKSSFKPSSRHLLFAPFSSRKRPTEAKTSRNSLSWTILQGTSLFSIFYSATLPVNPTKQRLCVQSRGGGTRGSSFDGITRPTVNDANLRLNLGRSRVKAGIPIERFLLVGVADH